MHPTCQTTHKAKPDYVTGKTANHLTAGREVQLILLQGKQHGTENYNIIYPTTDCTTPMPNAFPPTAGRSRHTFTTIREIQK